MSSSDPRAAAARSIGAVYTGESLDRVLDLYRDHPARALIFELCYGVVRHWFSLSEQLDSRLKKPLRKKDFDLYCLMLIGSYQLQNTAIANHAAVSLTVEAARHLGKQWACGLVNAIFRSPRESVDDRVEAEFEAALVPIKVQAPNAGKRAAATVPLAILEPLSAVSAEPLSAGKVPDNLAIGKVPLVSSVALRAVKEAPLPDRPVKGLLTVMFPEPFNVVNVLTFIVLIYYSFSSIILDITS